MKLSQSPLLRIYQQTYTLITLKRNLFESIKCQALDLTNNPPHKNMSSSKIMICLKKLMKLLNQSLYQLTRSGEQGKHVFMLSQIVSKLKNDSQLLTQEEKLIEEANKLIEQWNSTEDPVIYYDQRQRTDLKAKLLNLLQNIKKSSNAYRQAKKPQYLRKLQRELRQNLQNIGEQQRNYNQSKLQATHNSKKNFLKLCQKLYDAIHKNPKHSLINDQKNQLLKKYIDVFEQSNNVSLKQSQKLNYRKDLLKTLRQTFLILKQQEKDFRQLQQYLNTIQSVLTNFSKIIKTKQEEIISQALQMSQDINAIVQFQQGFDIFAQIKKDFNFIQELKKFKIAVKQLSGFLDQSIKSVQDYIQRSTSSFGTKNIAFVSTFLQDKKFFQSIAGKQLQFQSILFKSFSSFALSIYKKCSQKKQKNFSYYESNSLILENVFDKIFNEYFIETQNTTRNSKKNHTQSSSQSRYYSLRNNTKAKIAEIQNFIKSFFIFDQKLIPEQVQTYQCSLGPRLLIHGTIRILPQGIHYDSKFNKRNYFFGQTTLFLPKQEIFELNKDYALFVFPDVIQVITKKGSVFFHALGKRQTMINHLNEMFFPQNNQANQDDNVTVYNQYSGQQTQLQNRIQPFTTRLQNFLLQGQILNISLKTFFNKYYSTAQFSYQGKSYKDFKYFSLEQAQGTNIQGTQFTPGIPSYMKLQGQTSNVDEDIVQSDRFFTYGKKVPMIPLVSKGGQGICKEKVKAIWGGSKKLVIQMYTTLSGFSLTQGMLVTSRLYFYEQNNKVRYQISGAVTFQQPSSLNNLLKSPAMSNLKDVLASHYEIIGKIQKRKKRGKKAKSGRFSDQILQKESQIQQLQSQNVRLRKTLKLSGLIALLLYGVTILIMLSL